MTTQLPCNHGAARRGGALLFSLLWLNLAGCSLSPQVDVVLVDRHTVMESEAAGEWPRIEERLRADINKGPLALNQIDESQRQERALRVLNGEYPHSSRQP